MKHPPTPRIAVPWYVHPAEDPAAWRLLAAKQDELSFVVINVHNGPGTANDPYYPPAVATLERVRLLGYVDVDYGRRSVSDVLADVRNWLEWYPVGGVMFDQLPADRQSVSLIARYVEGARRAGAGFVVGNPGTMPPLATIALLDVTAVFEGDHAQYDRYRAPIWLRRIPRERLWHLIFACDQSQIDATVRRAGERGAGHVFVTDRRLPNPWAGPPTRGDLDQVAIPDVVTTRAEQ